LIGAYSDETLSECDPMKAAWILIQRSNLEPPPKTPSPALKPDSSIWAEGQATDRTRGGYFRNGSMVRGDSKALCGLKCKIGEAGS
jgi:hypothetical protein